MKKILFLLGMLLCSLNVIGAEQIASGYCEGRGKILDKTFDHPFLTISMESNTLLSELIGH